MWTDATTEAEPKAERNRRLDRDEAIAAIAEALVHDVGLDHILHSVIQQSQRVLRGDAVAVWLVQPWARRFALAMSDGFSPAFSEVMHQFDSNAPLLCARTARTEEVQLVHDLQSGDGTAADSARFACEEMRSLLAMPLRAGGRLIGVIVVASHRPGLFAESDRPFYTTIANLFAVAIENGRLFDQLGRSLYVREEFIRAAAHELRTPVTVIKGRSQMLLRNHPLDEDIRQGLDSIHRQGDRIARLTDDLLMIARLQVAPACVRRRVIDLNRLVAATVDQIADVSEGHQLRVDSCPRPLVTEVDPMLLCDVIRKLIENALRYTSGDGVIEIATRRRDPEAVVSITDHGVGIRPERQSHVFEPFYDPVPSGEPGYAGRSSLGLYAAKLIVEAHDGRIWLQSAPGEGSTFSFAVPLKQPPA